MSDSDNATVIGLGTVKARHGKLIIQDASTITKHVGLQITDNDNAIKIEISSLDDTNKSDLFARARAALDAAEAKLKQSNTTTN